METQFNESIPLHQSKILTNLHNFVGIMHCIVFFFCIFYNETNTQTWSRWSPYQLIFFDVTFSTVRWFSAIV